LGPSRYNLTIQRAKDVLIPVVHGSKDSKPVPGIPMVDVSLAVTTDNLVQSFEIAFLSVKPIHTCSLYISTKARCLCSARRRNDGMRYAKADPIGMRFTLPITPSPHKAKWGRLPLRHHVEDYYLCYKHPELCSPLTPLHHPIRLQKCMHASPHALFHLYYGQRRDLSLVKCLPIAC
jgi:hypothetical protein